MGLDDTVYVETLRALSDEERRRVADSVWSDHGAAPRHVEGQHEFAENREAEAVDPTRPIAVIEGLEALSREALTSYGNFFAQPGRSGWMTEPMRKHFDALRFMIEGALKAPPG